LLQALKVAAASRLTKAIESNFLFIVFKFLNVCFWNNFNCNFFVVEQLGLAWR
jgi:hypothetical protein